MNSDKLKKVLKAFEKQILSYEKNGMVYPDEANDIIRELGGNYTVHSYSDQKNVWCYIQALSLKYMFELIEEK